MYVYSVCVRLSQYFSSLHFHCSNPFSICMSSLSVTCFVVGVGFFFFCDGDGFGLRFFFMLSFGLVFKSSGIVIWI